jgi:uncharacterized protein (DUF2062 family)
VKLSLSIHRWLHRKKLSRKSMRGGFLHSKLGDRILDKSLWRATPDSIARAWLIGMPITMIPFLPGQSIIASVLGFTFRANLLVCIGLQYLSNPFTAVVQLPACFFIGRLIQGNLPSTVWDEVIQRDWEFLLTHPTHLARDLIPLFLGSIILGAAIGVIGYLLILNWGRRHAEKLARKKAAMAK